MTTAWWTTLQPSSRRNTEKTLQPPEGLFTASAPPVSVGMCGFSGAECALLLDNGLRPWDEDAMEMLEQLKRKQGAAGVLV